MQGQGAFWFDLTDLQLPRSCKEHDGFCNCGCQIRYYERVQNF